MKGKELLKLLKRYAGQKDIPFNYDGGHGKGGHGRVYVGDKFTTIPSLHQELKTGLTLAIIKQLGIDKRDLGL